MAAECPVIETRAPGIVIARYEWPHLLLPELQGECLACALATSARGPVGMVFVLAERICEVAPNVRGFWRKVVSDPAFRIAAMAVVTTSWAVEVEAMGFAAIIEQIGAPLRVATFAEEHEGIAWVARLVRSTQLLYGSG
jgi:hypothetical protein